MDKQYSGSTLVVPIDSRTGKVWIHALPDEGLHDYDWTLLQIRNAYGILNASNTTLLQLKQAGFAVKQDSLETFEASEEKTHSSGSYEMLYSATVVEVEHSAQDFTIEFEIDDDQASETDYVAKRYEYFKQVDIDQAVNYLKELDYPEVININIQQQLTTH
jgi:predicted ATP-binding protein involved in virulence